MYIPVHLDIIVKIFTRSQFTQHRKFSIKTSGTKNTWQLHNYDQLNIRDFFEIQNLTDLPDLPSQM